MLNFRPIHYPLLKLSFYSEKPLTLTPTPPGWRSGPHSRCALSFSFGATAAPNYNGTDERYDVVAGGISLISSLDKP